MKVKIGDRIYDTKDEPIMLIFKDDEDLKQHANLLSRMENKPGPRKYLMFPQEKYTVEEMQEFMKMSQRHVFKISGLSKEKSFTCETKDEVTFWPGNNLIQSEFDSLWEFFQTHDIKGTLVTITCEGLREDGTPINGVIESTQDIFIFFPTLLK